MSIDTDPSFWKWLVGFVGTMAGSGWGYHKFMDGKLSKKADKDFVIQEFKDAKDERAALRGHVAKIFDQIRENEQRAQDRHERLMDKLR